MNLRKIQHVYNSLCTDGDDASISRGHEPINASKTTNKQSNEQNDNESKRTHLHVKNETSKDTNKEQIPHKFKQTSALHQ